MTIRSVLLGLLGATAICGLSYLNDQILRQTYLVGNNMPVAVYGILILVVVLINPILRRLSLTGKELAVILTLTLAACCIPGSGLLRSFTTSLMLPHHYNRLEPGWRENKILETCPKVMLAEVTEENSDRALDGFVQGLGENKEHIALREVPWGAWGRTLAFWVPIILCLWGALMALSVVVHRQWSTHEHLPYPVASFASSLMPEPGQRIASIFRNRLFWLGAGAVLAIHLNNYLCRWFPDFMIPIPVRFDLTPLHRLVPVLGRGGGVRLLAPVMYFSVIGLSYFLASDVALSCGIGPFLWALVTGIFATYGITLTSGIEGTGYTAVSVRAFLNFGSNFGMFLALVYLGRRHYWTVLRRAFGLRARDAATGPEIWAMRIFMALSAGFVALLISAGLDWPLAILYTGIIVMFFTMMSRIMAETGMFYIQPFYFPCGVIWGLFGSGTLGLEQLMILLTVSMILVVDPRESLMPFMSTSLKLLEMKKVKIGRTASWSAMALVLGLAVALPLTLYFQYDRGVCWADSWSSKHTPRMQFDNIRGVKQKLEVQGRLEEAASIRGLARFANMRPTGACVLGLALGMVLVLGFVAARIRFPWWPLHPVLFLTWATEPQWRLCGAFMVGWLVKKMTTKYGGARVYQRLKPLMIGLIAGEVMGAIIPSIFGAIYFACTGEPPKPFWVLPG
ncbi:MAG: hypothetical protein HN849_19210 [Victivallales bacterium]|nr:hypothetical protein [Victivallales bacterium]